MLTSEQQQDRSPIIVDDSYDLEETVALTFGGDYNEGLLAKADLGAALLSMSGYEKSSISNLNGMFSVVQRCLYYYALVVAARWLWRVTQKSSVTNISIRA